MDTHRLLDNFTTFADAAGGVQRLRSLVLDLAVSGRLVEQNPAEGQGETLLAEIAAKRAALKCSMLIQRPITSPSHAFQTPIGWSWSRMSDLHTKMGAGSTPTGGHKVYVESGVAFLRSQNVWNDGLRLRDVARIPMEVHARMAGTAVQPGDVLLNITGASIGRCCVVPQDFDQAANVSQHVAILRQVDERTSRWIQLFLISPRGFGEIMARQVGMSREGLSMKRLSEFTVPVPPLLEQVRILSKVNALMALCNELEDHQRRRDSASTKFRRSALQALADSTTTDDLRQGWERVSANWPTITNNSDSVTDLRGTIAEMAVKGRITGRAPTDRSVETIIDSARVNALDPPELVNSEGLGVPDPFEIPSSWRWVTLGGVTADILAGWSAPSTQEVRSREEWAVLKVSACSWGEFRPGENKALEAGIVPKEELEVRSGDFLISRANTSSLVARSVVVGTTPPRLMLSDKTLRIRPVDGCNARYLNLANLAPHARAHYEAEATGTSDSMKNVSQRAIRRTPIPLPPSAEQDRIVATVDRLNGLCDDLARALDRRSDIASRLSESLTT